MRYALIETGVVVEEQRDPRRGLLTYATDAELAALGWYPIDESAVRPADTATERYERTVDLPTATTPIVVWNAVAKTQAEQDADAADADRLARRAAALAEDMTTLLAAAATVRTTAAEIRDRTLNNNTQRNVAIADLAEEVRSLAALVRQTMIVVDGTSTTIET